MRDTFRTAANRDTWGFLRNDPIRHGSRGFGRTVVLEESSDGGMENGNMQIKTRGPIRNGTGWLEKYMAPNFAGLGQVDALC